MRGAAQASPRHIVAGALLNSCAGSTVPQLPLKSSSNRPGLLGQLLQLDQLPREAAIPHSLGTQAGNQTLTQRSGGAGLSLVLPPANSPKSTGCCTWLDANYSLSGTGCGPAAHCDHLLCSIQQQAPGKVKPTPSPTEGRSLLGKKGRSPATKATMG